VDPPLARQAPPDERLLTPVDLVRHTFAAMGTSVTVLVPAEHAAEGRRVEDLFSQWNATFSRFDPDSELSLLNAAAGRPRPVSDLMFEVLSTARQAAEATNGLFDPTLLRPLESIGYDRDFAALDVGVPGASPTSPKPRTGGWRRLRLVTSGRTAELPVGVGLDLGGLAKGMAVDAAIDGLATRGVRAAAVDAGGDLAVLGLPAGQDAWSISIDGPDRGRTVSLRAGALATSSTARRRWRQGDVLRHHLVDPRTALPSTSDLWSASVAAPSCTRAEVAAKAAFLLGPEEGSRFLVQHGLAGLFIASDGTDRLAGAWGWA
jgi:thiamine biosynthesis lipoprotein